VVGCSAEGGLRQDHGVGLVYLHSSEIAEKAISRPLDSCVSSPSQKPIEIVKPTSSLIWIRFLTSPHQSKQGSPPIEE